ncbi:hypothetical protein T492DRAFT_1095089 [Pavlovales sp. CCMP2436]|nr:hypothetical protein T492DRAFT_1095089 [Pavlovales sp. CCMP2436]
MGVAAQVVPALFTGDNELTQSLTNTQAHTVAEMLAVGLGLPRDALTTRMAGGPHLLAPTGADLHRHRQVGTVLAGWHRDLNLLTLHGKCRFPGLNIWLRDGTMATANAVSFTEAAAATTGTAAAEAGGEVPGPPHLWRVSSTMFAHANSAVTLRPLLTVTPARLSSAAARDGRPPPSLAAEGAYPSVRASEQVMAELRGIALAKS